jgi:DNA-binding transcriptional MerR regulator
LQSLAVARPRCSTSSVSELLAIGRFARACRLGIKALRNYDELGLLRPARVDASGYRYYARSQARTAIAISLLRSLDVPLAAIKDVLASKDPAALGARLAIERARLEREVARAKQSLFCVDRIIRDGALMPYEVSIREEPGRVVLSMETTTRPELHVEAGYELFGRLKGALRALGLPLAEPVICLLPEPPDDDTMILRMCSLVDPGAAANRDVSGAGASIETLAAAPFAFVTHRGPYQELGLAQHAIVAWIEEQGHSASGPMREIYVDDPANVADADLRTEVGVPVVLRP